MSNYYLYKAFYFSEIHDKISLVLEELLENQGGPCFGFIEFQLSSEETLKELKETNSLACEKILDINLYFIDNGVNVGETILIKF